VPHIHIKIRRWVLWWFYVGVVCGVVGVVNILTRDLTRVQEHLVLTVGVVHWVVGGLVCWASDAVRIHEVSPPAERHELTPDVPAREWHPGSDFLLPGHRKSLLPPKY
jgi:hypothetical protein